jgi:hypothetical protein
MSNFGNLLTTGSSTPWSPFQSNVNAILQSSITASGLYTPNPSAYPFNYITGSGTAETNEYGKALGMPTSKNRVFYSNSSWIMSWTANTDPDGSGSATFDLDQGIGRTEALDSFIIQSANNNSFVVGGYAISASNDGSSWTGLTSSLYYPGGTGIPLTGYDATMAFTNNTAYRYYKIMLLDGNGDYGGISGAIAWDSSLFKNQINLFNPNEANVTASFTGDGYTSLELFTSPQRDNFGWYFIQKIGSADFNWGDGEKLIRGWFGLAYSNLVYFPGIVQFYKSKTGELDSWELFSTVNLEESQGPMTTLQDYFIEFGTPVKTQYLRIVMYGEGSVTPANNMLMWNGWMYEMSSSQTPPPPTNITASAFQNNVGLTWSQNSGSDNRLVDVIYNIERSSDGGSNYDPVVTLSGSVIQTAITSSVGTPVETSYVDSNLADGTYLYRIQSKNQHHLATSSFVTTTEVTVPVAGKKIWNTNKGNIMFNPNDTILIEIS